MQKQITQKEVNPFHFERTKASNTRKLSLRDILETVLGYRPCHMSKRLLPAMGLANGRIYFSGLRSNSHIAIWDGDLDFYKFYKTLARIAEKYGVILKVFSESGQNPVWTSEKPDAWLGFVSEDWKISPVVPGIFPDIDVAHVYPHYRKMAEESQKQWLIDHGLVKEKKNNKKGVKMAAKAKVTKSVKKTVKKTVSSKATVSKVAKGRAGSSRRS